MSVTLHGKGVKTLTKIISLKVLFIVSQTVITSPIFMSPRHYYTKAMKHR
jgi:hypothetical protein